MRKIAILFLTLLTFVFVPFAFAQENIRTKELSVLEKDEIINDDYFSSGEKVILSGEVLGDAYLAGGNIVVDGFVGGDLLVVGGNINIDGEVEGDVRVAGGNVNITGKVGGNVSAFGGNVQIAKSAEIFGSLVSGAGNVDVLGLVGNNATVGSGMLTIGNDAGINGNLVYFSDEDADISKGATISGQITKRVMPHVRESAKSDFDHGMAGWSVYSFLSSVIFGILFLVAFPNFTQTTVAVIRSRPWASLGIGFLVLISVPLIVFLLAITLIGIPLAAVLLVSYIFMILFAKIFTGIAFGSWVLQKFGQKQNPYLSLTLGLLLLSVLKFVPFFGMLVGFAVTLFGIGAYAISKRNTYISLRSKKAI